MLYREIIAVCSQIHTKHINTLCGQNVEFSDRLATQLQLASSYLSASNAAEQLSYRWTDFYEILYLRFYFIRLNILKVQQNETITSALLGTPVVTMQTHLAVS